MTKHVLTVLDAKSRVEVRDLSSTSKRICRHKQEEPSEFGMITLCFPFFVTTRAQLSAAII